MCTVLPDPASPAAPKDAITSPKALRLLLIAWVSRNRSLSFAAPEDDSLSEPARSCFATIASRARGREPRGDSDVRARYRGKFSR